MAAVERLDWLVPTSPRGRWARAGALFVTGVVFHLLLIRIVPAVVLDEGHPTYGAARVLSGDVPYRDFWVIYAPGQFYTLAGVFAVFGRTLAVERVFDCLIRSGIALASLALVRTFTRSRFAVLVWVVALLTVGGVGFFAYSVFPALLLVLLALGVLSRFVLEARPWQLTATGALTALALVFRIDLGAYCLIAVLVSLAVVALQRRPPGEPWPVWVRRLVHRGRWFLLALLLPLVVVYGGLALFAPGREIWGDLVVYPLTKLHAVRRLPYPPLLSRRPAGDESLLSYLDAVAFPWVRFYLPLIALAAAATSLVMSVTRRKERWRRPEIGALVPIVVVAGGLFCLALARPDAIHLLPVALFASLLAMAAVGGTTGRLRQAAALVFVGILASAFVFGVGSRTNLKEALTSGWPRPCPAGPPAGGCVPLDPDQVAAVDYVRARAAPGERIFVGNSRSDKIFITDVLFYFLAERQSATRYHDLAPGVATTAPIQREIVAELESHQVRYVVLVSRFDGVNEPNASATSSGVRILDDYIHTTFVPEQTFGGYTVLRRRP